MSGSNEISRLAELLRVSADSARRLASFYSLDTERMAAVARQTEAMAAELDEISTGVNTLSPRRRDGGV